jgi:hypothetical protein
MSAAKQQKSPKTKIVAWERSSRPAPLDTKKLVFPEIKRQLARLFAGVWGF